MSSSSSSSSLLNNTTACRTVSVPTTTTTPREEQKGQTTQDFQIIQRIRAAEQPQRLVAAGPQHSGYHITSGVLGRVNETLYIDDWDAENFQEICGWMQKQQQQQIQCPQPQADDISIDENDKGQTVMDKTTISTVRTTTTTTTLPPLIYSSDNYRIKSLTISRAMDGSGSSRHRHRTFNEMRYLLIDTIPQQQFLITLRIRWLEEYSEFILLSQLLNNHPTIQEVGFMTKQSTPNLPSQLLDSFRSIPKLQTLMINVGKRQQQQRLQQQQNDDDDGDDDVAVVVEVPSGEGGRRNNNNKNKNNEYKLIELIQDNHPTLKRLGYYGDSNGINFEFCYALSQALISNTILEKIEIESSFSFSSSSSYWCSSSSSSSLSGTTRRVMMGEHTTTNNNNEDEDEAPPHQTAAALMVQTLKYHNYTLQGLTLIGSGNNNNRYHSNSNSNMRGVRPDGDHPDYILLIDYFLELNRRGRNRIFSRRNKNDNDNDVKDDDTDWIDLLVTMGKPKWDLDWYYFILRTNPILCSTTTTTTIQRLPINIKSTHTI